MTAKSFIKASNTKQEMPSTKHLHKSKLPNFEHQYIVATTNMNIGMVHDPLCFSHSIIDEQYQQGLKDGKKDKEMELLKMGKALFQMAINNAQQITGELISAAQKDDITIHDFYLMVEDWDKIHSLIVVKLEDFIDDKIYNLYNKATKLALDYNCDSFHWEYRITYYSDNLSKDKILSDGFIMHYEHSPASRTP